MAQLNILTGIYAETSADLERSYPVNLDPHVEQLVGEGSGLSKGYLKLALGVATKAATGADRGGYDWRGVHYRVIGTTLVTVAGSGAQTTVGEVGSGGRVTFAESFDRLGVASGGRLYYLSGTTLTQVTDPDLGEVLSATWSDGYFLTTDGTSIVATELNDPAAVDPLKYGSSEADPDPVKGLLALRGTVFALNRYSIEAFENSGSTGFPFRRNRGSQIPKGTVGPHAFCAFIETFAFCGSARNEPPGVYLAGSGQGIPISPRALARELAELSETALASVELETVMVGGMIRLLVHLPARTWVYHWTASQQVDIPVWSVLAGGARGQLPYAARGFVWTGGEWWCGSSDAIGTMTGDVTSVFGEQIAYRFETPLVYNAGAGAIVHDMELTTLGGRGASVPTVFLSYTDDGLTYSQERPSRAGGSGGRGVRPAWRRLGRLRNWRGFRFRGVAEAPIAFVRLEAVMEGLGGSA